MVFKATTLIANEMEEQGFTYSIKEFEKVSEVYVEFGIKNGPHAAVRFLSADDNNCVSVRLLGLVNHVSEENEAKVLKAVNECNNKYRFIKFVLDSDRDVNMEFDIPMEAKDDSVGPEACEILVRMMGLADDTFPVFMKAIWG